MKTREWMQSVLEKHPDAEFVSACDDSWAMPEKAKRQSVTSGEYLLGHVYYD